MFLIEYALQLLSDLSRLYRITVSTELQLVKIVKIVKMELVTKCGDTSPQQHTLLPNMVKQKSGLEIMNHPQLSHCPDLMTEQIPVVEGETLANTWPQAGENDNLIQDKGRE